LLRKLSLTVRDKDVTLLDFFQERIGNIHVLKLYHREAHELDTHVRLSETLIRTTLKSVKFRFISVFLVSLITTMAAVAVMWYGGLRVIDGGMSFGALFAFYLYTTRLYGPIQSIANRGVEIYNGLASAQRIIEYLDMAPDITDAPDAVRLERVAGAIAFHNVCFRYPRNDVYAVRNLTLNIPAGQKVALVGSSGAGKSTIVNLLGRLYDVESGSIRLDDHDIRLLALDSLYGAIGVIPQDTLLFNASIEENIRYGRVDATREEVIEATKRSHLHEFISQLPQGYDTLVGPRGAKLSGGQRQRVALARMILKDAPIWILDEFTSSLDSPSESVVYENILPLLREKTAIIIAHRLSTILSADKVVVIHAGQIVESGRHTDLYNRNGFYRRLFDKQFFESALNSDPSADGDELGAPDEPLAAVSRARES
jgi:subfamily B ATP-binding cassette protein MsbA